MPHLVLLGDSILDNGAYVGGGPAVIDQVRAALPAEWESTLLAVDGAVIRDVHPQLARLPLSATHLVLSVGGNDALDHSDLLNRRVSSSAVALGLLADAAAAFEQRYRVLVRALADRALPFALCTVYYPSFTDPVEQRLAVTALSIFNDAILRVAFEHRSPVIDLRLICDSPRDYANPIEPSAEGGAKIARVLVQYAVEHADRGRTTIYHEPATRP